MGNHGNPSKLPVVHYPPEVPFQKIPGNRKPDRLLGVHQLWNFGVGGVEIQTARCGVLSSGAGPGGTHGLNPTAMSPCQSRKIWKGSWKTGELGSVLWYISIFRKWITSIKLIQKRLIEMSGQSSSNWSIPWNALPSSPWPHFLSKEVLQSFCYISLKKACRLNTTMDHIKI